MLAMLSIMVSGVWVAWRRIDAASSVQPYHHPYKTQSYGETDVRYKTSGVQYNMQAYEADAASDPAYKTLVLYVYHESDEVTKENLLFFLKVRMAWRERGRSRYTCFC
jgi:hypothetical protein